MTAGAIGGWWQGLGQQELAEAVAEQDGHIDAAIGALRDAAGKLLAYGADFHADIAFAAAARIERERQAGQARVAAVGGAR